MNLSEFVADLFRFFFTRFNSHSAEGFGRVEHRGQARDVEVIHLLKGRYSDLYYEKSGFKMGHRQKE